MPRISIFFFFAQLVDDILTARGPHIFFCSFDTIFITEKAYGDDGCLKQPKELSINKVGHGKYGHGAVTFS
jgi:hypothetical protein